MGNGSVMPRSTRTATRSGATPSVAKLEGTEAPCSGADERGGPSEHGHDADGAATGWSGSSLGLDRWIEVPCYRLVARRPSHPVRRDGCATGAGAAPLRSPIAVVKV